MVRCVGRRYPNNEIRTMGGCTERPPPIRFEVFMEQLTGDWAVYNGTWEHVPYDMGGTGLQSGFNEFSRWRRTLVAGKIVEVFTEKVVVGSWQLRVVLTQGFAGGGLGIRTYTKGFTEGYPKWVTQNPRSANITPLWTFGGPVLILVRPQEYDDLPPDFCDV